MKILHYKRNILTCRKQKGKSNKKIYFTELAFLSCYYKIRYVKSFTRQK